MLSIHAQRRIYKVGQDRFQLMLEGEHDESREADHGSGVRRDRRVPLVGDA